jgi:hypothetical protein
MNSHQTPYNKKGFTLIEAVFSTLVASIVIGFVYTFFGQSTQGIAHSESANFSIRQLQLLSDSIRQKLSNLEPFPGYNGTSIEMWNRPVGYPLVKKYYQPVVYEDTVSGGDAISGIKATTKVHKLVETIKGVRKFEAKRVKDNWFPLREAIHEGLVYALEDAIVHLERNITQPISASVSEYYIYTNGTRLVYRHYLKDDSDNDLNYVVLLADPPTKKLEEAVIATYGLTDKGEGLISGFEIYPTFEYSHYKTKEGGMALEFKHFFISTHIKIDSKIRNEVSKQSSYSIDFNVMNPQLNTRHKHSGQF